MSTPTNGITAAERIADGSIVRTAYDAARGEYYEQRISLADAYQECRARLTAIDDEYDRAMRKLWLDQTKESAKSQAYINDLFHRTLDHAASTYKLITRMSSIMFGVGIALVVFAALYGTLGDSTALAAVFGGLGVTTFVAVFVAGPLDDAQTALSNLLQGEVAFMTFFEQIRMLANYAWDRETGTLDCEKAERASLLLQRRLSEEMRLLQTYLEAPRRSRFTGLGRVVGRPAEQGDGLH
jgi:hypothetical protein